MLLLFLVSLNSMILIISIIILNDNLSAVRDKCLAEHYVIVSSLIKDIQALEQRGICVEENIDNLMYSYSRYLQGKGDGLAVARRSMVLSGRGKCRIPRFDGFGF